MARQDDGLLQGPEEGFRHGPGGGMRFFPDFALREALTASVFLIVLLVLASITRAPLEETANPQASGYIPRPEWYFLWLFQLLKYFKGDLEPVGTFLIPSFGIALLVALPFLDRRTPSPKRLAPRTRPVRIWPRVAGAVALLAIGGVTLVAVTSSHPMTAEEPKLSAEQTAGKNLFSKMGCPTCHLIGNEGGDRGPDLTHFGAEDGARQRVLLHFAGIGPEPGSEMPAYQLSASELEALSAYLLSRT